MRKAAALALILSFVSLAAFAHAGHIHNFLGVVKSASADQLVITSRAGQQMAFNLTNRTVYLRDGKSAARIDLVRGLRVAVHVADDGKTATEIKLGSR